MSNMYDLPVLSSMKRTELQKLAKKNGIKANMKTDDLIKALAALGGKDQTVVAESSVAGEQTTTSASSTEDQSENEVVETKKPKSRRGRGKKQKAIKVAEEVPSPKKSSPQKTPSKATTSESESDVQASSTTEDEKTPVAKKSKAKAVKGRGRGRGKRGKKVEPSEEQQQQQQEQPLAVQATVAAASPAAGGRRSRSGSRSRSRQATPASAKPAAPSPAVLLTPPNSGSSRVVKKALRRTTHTPTPKSAAKTPKSPAQTKRSSRSASKTLPVSTTPKASVAPKTPVTAPKGSATKRPASGSAGSKAKKARRGTFDKSPVKETTEAAASAERIEALKDQIMAEIDLKVQQQVAESKKKAIPTRSQPNKKTVKTPKRNWSKTHHGAFNKMESIDDYLERKKKRIEALSATKKPKIPVSVKSTAKPKGFDFASPKPNTKPSVNPKSAKTVSFKVSKLKTPKKPTIPSLVTKGNPSANSIEKRQATPGVRKSVSVLTPGVTAARKSVGAKSVTVVTPTTAAARKSVAAKSVTVVTPTTAAASRKSVGVTPGAQRKSLAGGDRKSLGGAKTPSRKSVGGNVAFGLSTTTATTPGKPKNAFDLKASLSKPLSYKPHTGKLKSFGESTQPNKANARVPSNIAIAKTLVKRPQLKGRDQRRVANAKHRAQKRDDSFMARRGVTAL